MFRKSPLKATRLHRRKRQALMAKGVLLFFLFGVALAGVAWLSHRPSLLISEIQVSGNFNVDAKVVKVIAEQTLTGSYFGIFPRANIFLYSKTSLEKSLGSAFSEIGQIRLRARSQVLSIVITERKPAYVWCKGLPKDRTEDSCYFMDSTGYIFAEAPNFSGSAYFKYFGLITADNPIGAYFLSPDQFKRLNQFQIALNSEGVEATACLAMANGTRDIYLSRGGKIIFKDNQDVVFLISSLKLIKDQTKILSKSDGPKLDYLDLRFGKKVYYMFVGDNSVQASP